MRREPVVGIAGVGLIGASIGLRAASLGWHVLGWDVDREHARIAKERGAIAEIAPSFADLAARVETLVLAAPLDATVALIEALVASGRGTVALVIDVASVKAPIARVGIALATFVATHPIAGSERSGPSAADAGLFFGRTWTFDPAGRPEAVAAARTFIAAMGATPYALASDEHDRIVALTSHLPQLVSVALGARLAPELDRPDVVALCGTGMRSMLRLSASSWPIWRAIVAANGGPIAQELRRLASVLSGVAEAIEAARPDLLADDFARSAGAVARLGTNASVSGAVEVATTPTDER